MKSLRFRAPGSALALVDLLARALPASEPAALRAAIRGGRVRVGGAVQTRPASRCGFGVEIRADLPAPQEPPPSELRVLARGDGWTVVDKPAEWPSHRSRAGGPSARRLAADTLGLRLEEVRPAHRLDASVSGAWLLAHDDDVAARLGRLFEQRAVHKVYRALAPQLPWQRGRLEGRLDGKRAATELRRLERRGDVVELELRPITGRTHQLRRHLAEAGAPLLADPLYGGLMVAGGLRLRAFRLVIAALDLDVTAPWPVDPWPDEPVWAPDAATMTLRVSDATLKALDRGHPWILTDTETTDPGRFAPGRLATIAGRTRPNCGWALIEGPGRVAARRWSADSRSPSASAVDHRVKRALHRRAELTTAARAGQTDAYRLIHGEADGLPGLAVDRYGGWLRLIVSGRAALALRRRVVATLEPWLTAELGEPPEVLEVIHLRDRPAGRLECVRRWPESPERTDGRIIVRERGLRFLVDMGLDEPERPRPGVGLFADQRANRERLAAIAREGGRWLNLFAHTGAFSVALLSAGAREVTSVDLSRPYLDVLNENLRLNDLLDGRRHHTVRREARRFLDRLPADARFDGIVLDPPTAAASGRRFWSIKRDGAALVGAALSHLAPGGHLLLCRNDRRARDTLEPLVRAVAGQVGVRLASVEPAPPSADFPTLAGFPEGDAFAGLLIRRA